MKSLKKVLGKHDRVWFFIEDDEKTLFLQWAKDNNCKWMNGDEIKPDEDNCGYHMGINKTLSIGFVGGMCWGPGKRSGIKVVNFAEIIDD